MPSRNLRRERKLWYDDTHHTPLGCTTCPEEEICGTLRVGANVFDCLSLCCGHPDTCDRVCRNNVTFADRRREIGGFALDTVPRAPVLATPALPSVIPVLFHGKCRQESIAPSAVALSLYEMVNRDGTVRYASGDALRAAYGIAPGIPIVLTGTDHDPPLERWWRLGAAQRRQLIRQMRAAGVSLVTTPNYSLFTDRPRWDDLHAMKRIALVHQEFLEEGLSAALHTNGRTETDFRHWTAYVAARPEITHIAYEFTTGTRWKGRCEQHATWLVQLAHDVSRPLSLVIRGGVDVLPTLTGAFSSVTLLETSAFMKTMKRQRAELDAKGALIWRPAPTALGAPLDTLFAENLHVTDAYFSGLIIPDKTMKKSIVAQA